MSNAHTAGPWQTQGWVPTWAYIPVHDAEHNLVASLYPNARGYRRNHVAANARLIAAAPDLLAAAQRALNYIENVEGEFDIQLDSGDMLRAAIAKATQP